MRHLDESDQRLIRLHDAHLRRCGLTTATRHHRRETVRRLAEALPTLLAEASEADLETWHDQLCRRVSLKSLAVYTSHVCCFFDWAESAGHVTASPARRLVRPKLREAQPRPIPEADLELALGCATEPLRTWLVLAGYMGLRAGEIARIGRADVAELAGRTVLAGIGKGAKPYRLPVPEQVLPYLRAHLHQPGLLWRRDDGAPLTGDQLSGRCNQFLRELGLTHTLHSLRHRFGTRYYQVTKDPGATRRAMRHTNMNTTMATYVEIGDDQVADGFDQVAATLKGPAHDHENGPAPAPGPVPRSDAPQCATDVAIARDSSR